MNMELRETYDQYVAYHREFREEFDRLFGLQIPATCRAPLLTLEGFVAAWQRWRVQGVETEWRVRFEDGYARQAAAFSIQLQSVLKRTVAASNEASIADAA